MARMFPTTLPESAGISFAERTIFDALHTQLPNTFSVYHSFHWTEERNTPREIDFIIFHPEKGFLVLEVKGGRILIENGEWITENKSGAYHISDPFRQVQDNMYFLLHFYKKQSKHAFPGIASYGVCFPDTTCVPAHAHPEMTRTNILFNHHLDDIARWIDGLYRTPYYGFDRGVMTPEAVRAFQKIVQPTLHLPLSIRAALQQQKKELAHINLFQDYLLDIFEDKHKVAIQGAAGTGKTWIAIKKAIRLVSQGKRCLFLCYNNLLSKQLKDFTNQYIQTEEDKEKLDIFTFHAFSNHIFSDYIDSVVKNDDTQKKLLFALAHTLYPDYDIKVIEGFIGLLSNIKQERKDASILQQFQALDHRIATLLDALLTESKEGYFNFNVPMALLTLLEDNSYLVEKYDAILIDEGQDFEKTWCDCIAYFLENKKKRIIYIFYDNNQNIFMKKKQLPIIDLISKYNVHPYLYKLRKNIRNTKSIYEFATTHTHLGTTAQAVDVEGIEPYEYTVDSEEKARKLVSKIVAELIQEHNIINSQIIVLTDRSVDQSIFRAHTEIGNFQLTKSGKGNSRNYIALRSVGRFKGLESDIVILVLHPPAKEKEDTENRNELLYVGYTRAKFLLYVVNVCHTEPSS